MPMPQLKVRYISCVRYVALFAQPVKQLGCVPGLAVNHGDDVGRQHTRHVFQQTAAGDVRHAFYR